MIIDIAGPIQNEMWSYGDPFPTFRLEKIRFDRPVFCEAFEGLHSQTGTYFETPAHFLGNDHYLAADVPLEKLVDIPCTVLNIRDRSFGDSHRAITVHDLQESLGSCDIRPGKAILVGTGWGTRWMEAEYVEHSPYFTYNAMMWLIDKRPYLLGSDFPRWENLDHPEGFFPEFYSRDILMLAPCVHLEQCTTREALLTVCPLNIRGTSCVPCRSFLAISDEKRAL